jgi:hypothetical protein
MPSSRNLSRKWGRLKKRVSSGVETPELQALSGTAEAVPSHKKHLCNGMASSYLRSSRRALRRA